MEMVSFTVDMVLGGAVFVIKGIQLVSAWDNFQEIHSTVSELRHQMLRDIKEMLEAMQLQGSLAGMHLENNEDGVMDFDQNTEPVQPDMELQLAFRFLEVASSWVRRKQLVSSGLGINSRPFGPEGQLTLQYFHIEPSQESRKITRIAPLQARGV